MNRIYFTIIAFGFFAIFSVKLQAQSLPVGMVGLEEYYRRKQLLGELDSTVSFSILPLNPALSFRVSNVFDPDNTLAADGYFKSSGPVGFANGKGQFQILPFSLLQQYNSNHPYGWNDGAMIPARGYQTMLSGGFYAKFGILSIQFRPEFVYAENKAFEGFASPGRSDEELNKYYGFYNLLDAPERFGSSSYNKVNWGQSNVRLTYGPASLGLSNENIWWGPGKRNSLTMTNNAPGFKHLTLNTVKPIKTPIGSFEAQFIAGKLENSNFTPLPVTTTSTGTNIFDTYNDDWRYLSAFNISYQPKWVPGLFLGFIRDFMSYEKDVKGFKNYFPYFFPIQKKTTGTQGDPFDRDQRISMYARWIFEKAHAEVYFEYGVNDNSYNYRDFIGSPDHARAYIFGISKLVPFKYKKGEFIQINAEINQLSQSVDRLVRPAGGFYQHYQIRQGYTNLGQVIGAGTGSGGNLQSLDISWVKGLKKFGLAFERYEHNADFYDFYLSDLNGQSRRWVDFALAAEGAWNYKNFVVNVKVQGIKSLNYQWRLKDYTPDEYYIPHNDVFNFHGELGVSFRF
ncbi:capsule assembly Wzi family protein [Pedobacter hartonius]|uniref:Capsule assembly protein Wzi n=1 Tax=Pedobacter hartonius TaxID=425514 RepID=A0A1H4FRV9_9SPHI|nr:capsule assembly Wzi family protein [Pedobacter hartonius]SEA99560.1 Capsule assembly protein Wzi [Pedobacter hartonius]